MISRRCWPRAVVGRFSRDSDPLIRAIERLAGRIRTGRLARMRVRPAGTAALLRGAPDADLVFVTHSGLEQLRQLADAAQFVPLRDPVRVWIRRIARADVPALNDLAPARRPAEARRP